MSGNRFKQGRAIFFAAIMVVSMVAIGFAGSAAAASSSVELNGNSPHITVSDYTNDVTVSVSDGSTDDGDNLYAVASTDQTYQSSDDQLLQTSSTDDGSRVDIGTVDVSEFSSGDDVNIYTVENSSAPADGDKLAGGSENYNVNTTNEPGIQIRWANDDKLVVNDDSSAEYDKITDAISDVDSGDEIIVQDGTYTGTAGTDDPDAIDPAITITTDLTLKAADGATPTIDTTGDTARDTGIRIDDGTGGTVTVEGFEITGDDTTATGIDFAETSNNDIVIKDNTISGVNDGTLGHNNDIAYGIHQASDTSGSSGSITIENNDISDIGAGDHQAQAISVNADNSPTIKDNTISNVNSRSDNEGALAEQVGIVVFNFDGGSGGLSGSETVSITDNTISNTRWGIAYQETSASTSDIGSITVEDNTVNDGDVVFDSGEFGTYDDSTDEFKGFNFKGSQSFARVNADSDNDLSAQLRALYQDNTVASNDIVIDGTQYVVNISQERISVDTTTTVDAEVLGVDDGSSPSFTAQIAPASDQLTFVDSSDSVAAGTAPSEGATLARTVASWGDDDTGSNGDVLLYDDSDASVTTDKFDSSNDIVWIDQGGNDQYDSGTDIALAGDTDSGVVQATGDFTDDPGDDDDEAGSEWSDIYAFDAAVGGQYDGSTDAIVRRSTTTSNVFSGGSFTFDLTPGAANVQYDATLISDSNAGLFTDVSDSVTSDFGATNITTSPADPVAADSVNIEGTLQSGDSPADSVDIQLVDPSDTRETGDTTGSDGKFTFSGITSGAADGGTYQITADGDKDRVFGEVVVDPAQANVTVLTDGDTVAGFQETFKIDVRDQDDNLINIDGNDGTGFNGYINVSGEFSSLNAAGDVVESSTNADGNYEWVRIDTGEGADDNRNNNADGKFQFKATPANGDTNISVSLENNDQSDITDTAGSTTYYDGLEFNGGNAPDSIDSDDEPDLVGSDSVAVATSDQDLFVNVLTPSSGETAAAAQQNVEIEVLGSDGEGPDGDDASTLDNATVELSGSGVDLSTGAAEFDSDTNLGDADSATDSAVQFDNVEPDEAGNITVDVTAVTDDGSEFTGTQTITVTGDKIASISPTTAQIEDNSALSVRVTDDSDSAVYNREVVLTQASGSSPTLTVYDQSTESEITGVSSLYIDGATGNVEVNGDDGGGTEINAEFSPTADGTYTAENITFSATGDWDVTVNDGASSSTDTAQSKDAISVSGLEAYEVSSNRSEALAGADELHTLNITEDGAEINASNDLGDLTASVNSEQTLNSQTTVDLDDDGTDDALQIDVNAENESAPLNISVDNSQAAKSGQTSLDVVEPEISTTLGGEPQYQSKPETTQNSRINPLKARYSHSDTHPDLPAHSDRVYTYTRIHTEGIS